jgi:hypothetical protein
MKQNNTEMMERLLYSIAGQLDAHGQLAGPRLGIAKKYWKANLSPSFCLPCRGGSF